MTEKEKMLAGYLYYAGGEELFSEHLACMDLCQEFNLLKPSALARTDEKDFRKNRRAFSY